MKPGSFRSPLFVTYVGAYVAVFMYWYTRCGSVFSGLWMAGIQASGLLGLYMCRSYTDYGALMFVWPVVGYTGLISTGFIVYYLTRFYQFALALVIIIGWCYAGFILASGL